MLSKKIFLIITAISLTAIQPTFAEDAKTAEKPAEGQTSNDRVNVDSIKEKYWAQGEQKELTVVQNRMYTKDNKFELGAFGGLLFSDPFLSIKTGGASFGYHINEYFAVHLFGWKHFVNPSGALNTFEATRGATTNTNKPRAYGGAEVAGSILYGKLSLIGRKIMHYDFHLLGGAGVTMTETGNYATPHVGLGQQVYLTDAVSLRLDYRLMAYRENIEEKVIPTKIGQVVGQRWNFTNSITFGLTFMFGPGSSPKKEGEVK
jgi:outer membrane beta-barrel protein